MLAWVPLLFRRRRPLPVLVAVAVLDAARAVVAGQGEPWASTLPLATILAVYTVGDECASGVAWTAAASVALGQFAVVSIAVRSVSNSLLYVNWAVIGTAVGSYVRERRRRITAAELRAEEAERTKEAEAGGRVSAERVRIARELHDSLAHHITVVNAQAGVAQYLLRTDPAAAETALSGIAENSLAALDELRATLGLLRDDSSADGLSDRTPTPGFDQLDALVKTFRVAGVSLTVKTEGEASRLSGVADLAAYRIVQEALSNATRHAPGAAIRLTIDWSNTSLSLNVTNEPSAAPPTSRRNLAHEGTGHGIIGMRERATAAQGTLTAGPDADGGFSVHAVLPLTAAIADQDRPDGIAELDAKHPPRAPEEPARASAMTIRVLLADDQALLRATFRLLVDSAPDIWRS
ncbi:MAG: sensor histidine kinase [Solirubrobacteraceae bacterium]